jgi:hypothetical protein
MKENEEEKANCIYLSNVKAAADIDSAAGSLVKLKTKGIPLI